MYGQIRNKLARHNLCFADTPQKPNYEKGEGTVVSFSSLTKLERLRQAIERLFGRQGLFAEGFLYYDTRKCGIGFHGDSERTFAIGVRLGAELPLKFGAWLGSAFQGRLFERVLPDGCVYAMNSAAAGTKWPRGAH